MKQNDMNKSVEAILRLGSIERVTNAFQHVKGFYEKHYPYKELATFVQWCKMLTSLRVGYEAGEQGIKLEYNPEQRFYITIMREDLSEPSYIGFELGGKIILEEYIEEAKVVNDASNETSPSSSAAEVPGA